MSDFPLLSHGQVFDVDPTSGTISVIFNNLEAPGLKVKLLYDTADGLRIHQRAMPTLGTWVLIACPYGDTKNAMCLGSYFPSQIDARTTDTDPYMEYRSHWSGAFDSLDGNGNSFRYFPDGTYEAFASTTSLPALTRHTVSASQVQQATAFPASERVASAVAARPYLLSHASGTTVSISAAGAVETSVAAGQTFTATANGAVITISATGNITLMGVSSVTLAAPAIYLNGTITQGAGTAGTAASLIGPLVVTDNITGGGISLDAHYHSGVTTGSGNTGVPVAGS
jgi:hypothetical protein